MLISKLHYITQEVEDFSHAQLAEYACKGGVDWVQLRVKNVSAEIWKEEALATKQVCERFGAKLIINDNVELAKEIGAHGVHLGKDDLSVLEAREILGDKAIIGGTANTIEDIQRIAETVNYIGLGPFSFTNTKENLSPILGIEGYKRIIEWCKANSIKVPIIAIGGIKTEDLKDLFETGIYGVAVSSSINLSINKSAAADAFIDAINKYYSEKELL